MSIQLIKLKNEKPALDFMDDKWVQEGCSDGTFNFKGSLSQCSAALIH